MTERTAPASEWLPSLQTLAAKYADAPHSKKHELCVELGETLGPEVRTKAEEIFAAQSRATLDRITKGLENKSAAVLGAMAIRSTPAPQSAPIRSAAPVGFQHTTKPNGLPSSMFNARHAIEQLGIECSYDEFHDRLIIKGQSCAVGGDTLENLDNQALMFRDIVLD